MSEQISKKKFKKPNSQFFWLSVIAQQTKKPDENTRLLGVENKT